MEYSCAKIEQEGFYCLLDFITIVGKETSGRMRRTSLKSNVTCKQVYEETMP